MRNIIRMQWWYIAVAVVLVIIAVVYFYTGSDHVEEFMTGCWVAPDDFCESAEVDSIMVVFDGYDSEIGGRRGYIVILPNGVKSPFVAKYLGTTASTAYSKKLRVAFTFDDGPNWGDETVMDIDMKRGLINISNSDNVLYAKLYRNNDISDMVKGIMSDADAEPLA